MQRSFLWLLVATLPFAHLVAQDYPIYFGSRAGVGAKYRSTITATESQESTLTQAGQILKQQKTDQRFDYIGVEYVTRSDQNERDVSITVEKLVKRNGDMEEPILPSGSAISVKTINNKDSFAVNGQAVSPDLEKFLHMVMPANTGSSSDQKDLGSGERKNVGDMWHFDGSAHEDLKNVGLTGKSLQGTVFVDSVEHTPGGNLLVIMIRAEAKLAIPAGKDFIIDDGTVRTSINTKLPVDPHSLSPWRKESSAVSRTVHKVGLDGITQLMKDTRTIEQFLVPLAK